MNKFQITWVAVCAVFLMISSAVAQSSGGIRGIVYDEDFESPLAKAEVTVAETGRNVAATEEGNYVISGLEPGPYTLIVSKEGYTRKVFANVVVPAGCMVDQDASLSGEFTDMEEFVVQDLNMGGASEEGLLNLRMEAPALMDAVGSDLMSQAGASDAAQALTLVPGTTIQDGKYAVVRGLPDRYVSSQMNGVRLPSADPDKRAVQLDQFPSAMIESVQVAKTFTPDQQGDASGGAVNIILKGIPEKRVLEFRVGTKYKTNVGDAGDQFLKDKGTSISAWGHDAGSIQPQDINAQWTGALGVSRGDSPSMYDWSVTAGDKFQIGPDLRVGFIGSVFYKKEASYYEGRDDEYWLDRNYNRSTLVPYFSGGGAYMDYRGEVVPNWRSEGNTSLFDIQKGTEELQWGTLGAVGAETENHELTLLYSYNFSAENTAQLDEDTRGKYYYFPDYDPKDPTSPGGADSDWPRPGRDYSQFAPFRRTEGLEYKERIASSLQLRGKHTLPSGDYRLGSVLTIKEPEFDWTVAKSKSIIDTPDRRTLSTYWLVDENGDPSHKVESGEGGIAELQRNWRKVEEVSDQYFYNMKLPFEAWNGDDGFLKVGAFNDQVDRKYDENTYYTTQTLSYDADWDVLWNEHYSSLSLDMEDYPLDVNYDGKQNVSAWYYMAEIPVFSFFKLMGGARFEKTDISTTMRDVDPDAKLYIPKYNYSSVNFAGNEGDANASVKQNDVLPALGFEFTPHEKITVRGSYTETIARMTFKELAPIQQVEEIGDDIFVGNPDLGLSSLKNYDLRFDYNPYPGGLISLSWFYKKIKDPIDYRQQLLAGSILATTADNYSEGQINGYEIEVRQSMGEWWDLLDGLSVGGNLTYIQSELDASGKEIKDLFDAGLADVVAAEYDGTIRDMMGTPEYLYNLNATYTVPKFGTELGLFYTVKGDALKTAGTQDGGYYFPHVYEKEYATLNFSLSQKLWERWKLGFKVKNLLNPEVQDVYRSKYTGQDMVKNSYKKGVEFSISLGCEF
ncbi:TonB-dependent receptor [Tichowtungia aerotolerans]|uniref:TonB-dependent receptor n=1 Tax=Tichowtungia aerotolerans TaxID=2697043 RepID=A0A6P1MD92_9BACT|nr:TonB-dependent receptor [Tichowtungia aerotolerans]QHI70038.1 TonB-dependent receptor [Tichowtungia aerotolerans]